MKRLLFVKRMLSGREVAIRWDMTLVVSIEALVAGAFGGEGSSFGQVLTISLGMCEDQDSRLEGRPVCKRELGHGDVFGSARCRLLPRTCTKIPSSQTDSCAWNS